MPSLINLNVQNRTSFRNDLYKYIAAETNLVMIKREEFNHRYPLDSKITNTEMSDWKKQDYAAYGEPWGTPSNLLLGKIIVMIRHNSMRREVESRIMELR